MVSVPGIDASFRTGIEWIVAGDVPSESGVHTIPEIVEAVAHILDSLGVL